MPNLSDQIENYIKEKLAEGSFIKFQRNQIARMFDCVPSQINYVLSTRFTPERGYLVESRRGGRGYIRIIRIKPLSETWENFFRTEGLDVVRARDLIKRLYDERLISRREAFIIESALREDNYKGLPFDDEQKSLLIKRLFYNMVMAVLRDNV